MSLSQLREVARRADFGALCALAEEIVTDPASTKLERNIAEILWSYGLLRLDVHRFGTKAICMVVDGLAALEGDLVEEADWAAIVAGMCHQVAGDHVGAERVFRKVLTRPLSPLNWAVCAGNLATTLSDQGRLIDAAEIFFQAGHGLDQLSVEDNTPTTARERQRVRLNLVDCLMQMGDFEGAARELDAVNVDHLTPLLKTLHLICLARLAMRRDSWDDAWTWGQQAHSLALEVGYPPFREAALGILVAVSGRNGRLSEQRRLVQEMASLMGTKGG